MFKKKPQEETSDQMTAAPGGKGSFLKRNWKRLAVIACAAAILIGVVLPRFRPASAPSASLSYIEVQPERRSITNVFSDSGTITAANTYEVRSLVRGTVLTADFAEGDTVEKDAVLYTVDSSDAANSVERAQLSLNQSQRNYEDAVNAQYVRTDVAGTVVSFSVAVGDVVSAGQEVAVIRNDATLLLTLNFPAADAAGFSAGQAAQVTIDGTYETLSGAVRSVSGEDTLSSGSMLVRAVTIAVNNAGGHLTAAQAATASVNGVSALNSARFSYQNQQTVTASASGTVAALCAAEGSAVGANAALLQLASDDLTRQVQSASDNLRSAELSLADAEETLEDYTITAPIAGTIIEKSVQAGETIGSDSSTTQTLCIIHDLSYLELTLNVDELDILSIAEGQSVEITADAVSDKTFAGVVTNVSTNGTTTGGTTTYPVTIRIDDYGELLPGMNATAEIVIASSENALSVPNAAIVRGSYVLITEGSPSAANAASEMTAPEGYVYVKVETGVSDNDYIEVTSGLQEGDTVAYDADAATILANNQMEMSMTMGPGGMGGGMPSGGGPGGGGMP